MPIWRRNLVYELERDFPGSRRLVALCARHPELSRLGAGSTTAAGCSRKSATRINGGGSATATWIAAAQAPKKRGLVIRGPQKNLGTRASPACGMLYAKRQGDQVLRRYHDNDLRALLEGAELDIADPRRSGPPCWPRPAPMPPASRLTWRQRRSTGGRAHLPRRRGRSGLFGSGRASSSTASSSGAASICPTIRAMAGGNQRRGVVPGWWATVSSAGECGGALMVQIVEQAHRPGKPSRRPSPISSTPETMPVSLVGAPGGKRPAGRAGGKPDPPPRRDAQTAGSTPPRLALEAQRVFVSSATTTKVVDFFDEDEVRRVYYPEMEAFGEGGERVRPGVAVFDHTLPHRPTTSCAETRKIREVVAPRPTTTTPNGRARNGWRTFFCRMRADALLKPPLLPSSRYGGRSAARSRAGRWQSPTRRASRPEKPGGDRAALSRPHRPEPMPSPTIRGTVGTGSRICAPDEALVLQGVRLARRRGRARWTAHTAFEDPTTPTRCAGPREKHRNPHPRLLLRRRLPHPGPGRTPSGPACGCGCGFIDGKFHWQLNAHPAVPSTENR